MNKRTLTLFAAVLIAWCLVPDVACAQRRLLWIDDFDGGIQNRLGGYRNTYFSTPSTATAMRIHDARCGREGLGLCLTADRKDQGYCGYWIHFFDLNAEVRRYIDATDYNLLSFWVKGQLGGEKFTVKLADEHWIQKEDSVAMGRIEEFLPAGVTTQWQEVFIPLNARQGLDLEHLGGITFDFHVPGVTTVYIDNVALKSSRAVKTPEADSRPRAAIVVQPAITNRFERAVWLWSTEAMLNDPAQADALFSLCAAHGIKQIWAQLLYDMKVRREGNKIVESKCVIRRENAYRRFLASAHKAGIEVHALEGFPEHAQRQYHHISLAIVDAVIAFNEGQPVTEHFGGIHFDNEPYLLVGWHDPARREQILFEYLALNSECQRRVRTASYNLKFGVDIPFWWQDRDERRHEAVAAVSFNGRRQAASYHLLEMLDNVGVMNYRDTAQGADGMIAHARDLLVHADRAARAKVFMGVETFCCPAVHVLFAVGRSRDQFEQAVRGDARELAALSRLDGHRLRVFDDGENVHVGIEVSDMQTLQQRIAIASTISKITAAFGSFDDDQQTIRQQTLCQALSRDREWSNVTTLSVRNPDTAQMAQLVMANATVQEKISFADDDAKRFSAQIRIAEEYYSRHPHYAGIAIHDYESFRKLMQGDPAQGDLAQDDPAQDDPAQDDPAQDDPAQNDLLQDDPAQDDFAQRELVQGDSTQ